MQQIPVGFRSQGLLTFRVILRGERYAALSQRTQLFQEALERISALPGVKSAAAVTFLPLTVPGGSDGITIEGRALSEAGQLPFADSRMITPRYFRAMEIPLLAGHEFTWSDTPEAQLAVSINQTMSRTYWPDTNPIGQRIKLGRADSPNPWWTIVGVAGDVRELGLLTVPRPTMDFPSTQGQDTGSRA
jgi:putative ABC transport system permease protein